MFIYFQETVDWSLADVDDKTFWITQEDSYVVFSVSETNVVFGSTVIVKEDPCLAVHPVYMSLVILYSS